MPSIDVGVIQQFFHPPVGLCGLSLVSGGPYSGSITLTRPAGPVGVDAFGLVYSVVLEPLGVGLTYGAVVLYEVRVAQIVVRHTFLTGEITVTQRLEAFADSDLYMFTEAAPHDVLVTITPGFQLDFYWVVIF